MVVYHCFWKILFIYYLSNKFSHCEPDILQNIKTNHNYPKFVTTQIWEEYFVYFMTFDWTLCTHEYVLIFKHGW